MERHIIRCARSPRYQKYPFHPCGVKDEGVIDENAPTFGQTRQGLEIEISASGGIGGALCFGAQHLESVLPPASKFDPP